jgi:isoleucyl-tRNA synthetase
MSDYKSTLNLPETGFPMRGDLANLVNGVTNMNAAVRIRRAIMQDKGFFPFFGFADMAGYDSPYVPGWDCHGLPIEHKVEQMIGKPGEKVSALLTE